jgi:molecular chaperone GrpE (heat shock protein)
MDTTRTALAQAAEEEQRVARAESAANSATLADAAGTAALHEHIATILTGMNEMCGGLQEIYGTVAKIADRDSNSERVFNTLHAELSDYKKDFIYEHLKPVIRPLLFLYDSMEQFEDEVGRFDTPTSTPVTNSADGTMPTRLVRQNTVYFREQLVEALRICEVTPMETPEGAFNPRFQKAVKTVAVEPEQDGQILSVVRSGWFLNGQLLRAAEVVVGKAK